MLNEKNERFAYLLQKHAQEIGKVMDFNPAEDQIFEFDFTQSNKNINAEIIADTQAFTAWIKATLHQQNCKFGVGGYFENRTLYARSTHFNTDDEPRRLHLGMDIWAAAGTPVYAAFNGVIHSYADNNRFGDYGPTIIIEHIFHEFRFFALYGHLGKASLNGLFAGKAVEKNELIGYFGKPEENGSWPPHLHYQLMFDMQGWQGDYPGVAKLSEEEQYLKNIPDPNLILRLPIQPK